MRVIPTLVLALAAFTGARFARSHARETASVARDSGGAAFAPSPRTAPFIAAGFREAAADLLYVRMRGYFIGEDSNGASVADLAEAIVTLDPYFESAYDFGANAMALAKTGVDQRVHLRAIALLEAGARRFPDSWRIPYLAGQVYTQDLKTEDENERREWDEKAALLIETASRKRGAPVQAATWAVMMRTKLGQHERAIASLKEMILITNDPKERRRLLDQIGRLQVENASAIGAEIQEQRFLFEREWKAQRPMVSPSMFVLLGPRQPPGFDMATLATGGRDLFVPEREPLEPVE